MRVCAHRGSSGATATHIHTRPPRATTTLATRRRAAHLARVEVAHRVHALQVEQPHLQPPPTDRGAARIVVVKPRRTSVSIRDGCPSSAARCQTRQTRCLLPQFRLVLIPLFRRPLVDPRNITLFVRAQLVNKFDGSVVVSIVSTAPSLAGSSVALAHRPARGARRVRRRRSARRTPRGARGP